MALDKELLRRAAFNGAANAVQTFVNQYNSENDAQVDVDADGPFNTVTVDGGSVHGAYELTFKIEDL